jgi:hypothetical protein
MRWCLTFLFLASADAAVLRATARAESLESSLELSGDWAAYEEAESEDRNFLLTQLDATEDELVKLEQFLKSAAKRSGVLAGLQISATPVKKNATVAVAPASKTPEAKQTAPVKLAAKDVVKKEASKPADKEMDPAKLMASLGVPSMAGGLGALKNQMALAPMLAMLKGLYQDSKDRIAQQNTREEKSKKWFAGKEAEHKEKLATIEGKFKNGTLSEEFRTNETRDETRYFTYWSRCRERQHRQFHTNLKIQHAMMMKSKKMMDMYEKALSGNPTQEAQVKKQLQANAVPEIVFLQDVQRTVGSFCRESLAEVRKERQELQEMAKESPPY